MYRIKRRLFLALISCSISLPILADNNYWGQLFSLGIARDRYCIQGVGCSVLAVLASGIKSTATRGTKRYTWWSFTQYTTIAGAGYSAYQILSLSKQITQLQKEQLANAPSQEAFTRK